MPIRYSDEFKSMIAGEYVGGMSMNEIKRKHSVSLKFVSDTVKNLGYKTRSVSEGMKKFSIDENYFSKIDTSEKAQILGMFYADGCLYKASEYSYSLSLKLDSKDENYLFFIRGDMKYEGEIKFYKNTTPGSRLASITLHSRKIIEDVRKLGIHERKSLDLPFPTEEMVPAEFLNSFVLGYYEGDGSFYFNPKNGRQPAMVSFCGTREFLEKLAEIVLLKLGVRSYLYQKPKHKAASINTLILKIGGNQQARKVMDWMYSSPTHFKMRRKFEKYQLFRQRYDGNGALKPEFYGTYKRPVKNKRIVAAV